MPFDLSPTAVATLAGFFATVLGLFAAGHALLNKRRPQSAFGWIAICLTLPGLGALIYFLFGINRVRTRARLLRRSAAEALHEPIGELPLEDGNSVRALHNGEQAYPAMLDAIMQAERRVYLSSYLFDTSDIGRAFVTALADAHERGAEVRVLLDGIGELYSFPHASSLLRRLDVPFGRFLPPRLMPPALRMNLRNHRKILVADDVAFAGGMNVAKRHLVEDTENAHPVVDLHFQLEGPVVEQLATVFVRDWAYATDGSLSAPPAPAAVSRGAAQCRVVADGPDDDADPLTSLLLRTVGSARRRIAIMTPYFIPPRTLMGALQAAALRGVDVAVVLPAKNNLPYVHWATRKLLWELLMRGVRVYYQPPPFVHSKLLLTDDCCAVVGSWNIDPRSLRLNFELAIEIREEALCSELGAHFERVRSRAKEVSLGEMDSRRLPERLRDGVAWLFSPYL
ncbi:MAG: PLDc N-terminal domain-containing protein [Gammaproteobacteria bacterium]|nr:PLDc N-terminal domain-containing protein [Gammaproteobacteria bacterium]